MHHIRTLTRRPIRIRIETIHLIRSLLLPNNNFFFFSPSSAILVAPTLVFLFSLMHHLLHYYLSRHAACVKVPGQNVRVRANTKTHKCVDELNWLRTSIDSFCNVARLTKYEFFFYSNCVCCSLLHAAAQQLPFPNTLNRKRSHLLITIFVINLEQ